MKINPQKTLHRFLDLLYPAVCHLCQQELSHGRHLCKSCHDSLPFIETPFCSRCGETYDGNIDGEFICPNCHGLALEYHFARAALHSDDEARKLVHDLKYNHQIHLAAELARISILALEDPRFAPYLDHAIIIPVPLHWRRQRKRRFNQSEEIAKCLVKKLKHSGHPNTHLCNALKRKRNTETQTRFSRKKRLKNLHEAFTLRPRYTAHIKDNPVILLDDVFTTGATANECARVLKQAGADSVAVLTVIRG